MPTSLGPVTHYEVLGVAESAGSDELRQAYLRKRGVIIPTPARARKRAAAEVRMRDINQAWAVLGNPDRRRTYDAERRAEARATRPDDDAGPDFVPIDDEDIDYAELLDDTPMHGTHVPRWLQVLPAVVGRRRARDRRRFRRHAQSRCWLSASFLLVLAVVALHRHARGGCHADYSTTAARFVPQ